MISSASRETRIIALAVACATAGCVATMELKPTSFKSPSQYKAHFEVSGLTIALLPILDEQTSLEQFNVNFRGSPVIPVRVIVQNKGEKEFLLDAKQVFGVTEVGDFYQSYDLDQSTRVVRRSEIGEKLATYTAASALAGAAMGAAIGAGVGQASGGSGDASRGASAGAIIGGTKGAAAGITSGADAIEQQVRREMRRADWGAQTIFRGELKTGYIFLPKADFREISFNLYDLMERKPVSAVVPFSNR